MSSIEIDYVSGIVRNLGDKISLSFLTKPRVFWIGITVINPIKHRGTKINICCNESWFCLFRKYGFVKPMDLIAIKRESFKISSTKTGKKVWFIKFHNKISCLFISDPLKIIGLNHCGFHVNHGIDKNILNKDIDIDAMKLIDEYLDFQRNDSVDYDQYYSHKNHRNKKLWKQCACFAVNIERDPTFDSKTYLNNYKKQRKQIMNNCYYDEYNKKIQCNDKTYFIKSIILDLSLKISLNTKQFNTLEQHKKWLKNWCFQWKLIDINDKYDRVKINVFKIPSIRNNNINTISIKEFKKILNDISDLNHNDIKQYIPLYIKNVLKLCLNDDDYKMDIDDIDDIDDIEEDESIDLIDEQKLKLPSSTQEWIDTNNESNQLQSIYNLLKNVYDENLDNYDSFHSINWNKT